MPAEIWAEATALADDLGVNAVRLAAGIDYGALRKRLDAWKSGEAGGVRADGQAPRDQPRFLDLGAALGVPGSQTVVEVADATGARLTIRLEAGRMLDVAGVVDAFRRSGR
jgi:hypothetical protein